MAYQVYVGTLTVAPELVITEINPKACEDVNVIVPATAAVVEKAVACGKTFPSVVFNALRATTPFWSANSRSVRLVVASPNMSRSIPPESGP